MTGLDDRKHQNTNNIAHLDSYIDKNTLTVTNKTKFLQKVKELA